MTNKTTHLLMCVTGSIAAYKTCSVIRELMRQNYDISVIMTDAAQKLVTSHTFRSLSGRPVITNLWSPDGQTQLPHIQLSEWADMLAIVPATANIIGKITAGIADEIVSTTWLACDCPKVIAPAMNDKMWANESVQNNVQTLRSRQNVTFIDPVEGRLANGKEADTGHLASIKEIVRTINRINPKD